MISRLQLKNILSFRDATIQLGQLNVLIGAMLSVKAISLK
jgi:predicted ATPase